MEHLDQLTALLVLLFSSNAILLAAIGMQFYFDYIEKENVKKLDKNLVK